MNDYWSICFIRLEYLDGTNELIKEKKIFNVMWFSWFNQFNKDLFESYLQKCFILYQ